MKAALALTVAALALGFGRVTGQSQAGPDVLPGAFADLQGRRIFYRDTGGSGVPIVFLHAGTGSSIVWQHQIPAVRAAGYRFVTCDRLGSGRSVLEERAEPGSAADDLQGLMEHLKIERFHLVGTAAGGIVAFDYFSAEIIEARSLFMRYSRAVINATDMMMGTSNFFIGCFLLTQL